MDANIFEGLRIASLHRGSGKYIFNSMKLLPYIWTGYKSSVVLEELVAMAKDVGCAHLRLDLRGRVSHEIFYRLAIINPESGHESIRGPKKMFKDLNT